MLAHKLNFRFTSPWGEVGTTFFVVPGEGESIKFLLSSIGQ